MTRRSANQKARPRATSKTWRTRRARGVQVLCYTALEKIPWLVHGFTLRAGGASVLGGNRVLNLGHTDWDTHENVFANRKKLLSALDAEKMQLVSQRQFHSALTRAFDAPPAEPLRGDAALTRTSGLLLAVLTADCVPILLVDTKRRAVAAVHAGWRGTLKRVAEKALGKMRMSFGSQPRDVLAVLGPSIGSCCYEVGAEVAQAFHSQFAHAKEWFEGPFDRLVSDDTPFDRYMQGNSGALTVVEGVGDHGCEYMTGGRVVVIGKTGRNFAAGMSGGLAYVLDEAGDFKRRCNLGMVDLEPLVDTEDVELVKDLLARHIRYTQSPVAARLLVDWERSQAKFVKVIPQDFKRVMAAIKKAQETGVSADEAVMASAHN